MKLTILYREPLVSCNYGCEYCPFAKRSQTATELNGDRHALERLIDWITNQKQHQFSIFFIPWGEALIHTRYQQALAQLSHLSHVNKVVIQTNLWCKLD